MICVPDVSLLDPDEIIRTSRDEKISYKLWRKQKIPPKPAPMTISADPSRIDGRMDSRPVVHTETETPSVLPRATCCEERIQELTAVIEQQQVGMNLLRKDYSTMQRDFDELRNNFQLLSQKMEEMCSRNDQKTATPIVEQIPKADPFLHRPQPAPVGRWSLPGESSESLDLGNVVLDSTSGRVLPDKSQMMSNLFKKYFPKGEPLSPTNVPILEYAEEEKSIATVNYLAKYKLMHNNDRVLDISQLKRQSKLF